ncbi:MAG: phospholipase A [Bdellovibrionaceae bacterium]|nr:phospholipase A [Pseudobdellovibrionaceae bacterium]
MIWNLKSTSCLALLSLQCQLAFAVEIQRTLEPTEVTTPTEVTDHGMENYQKLVNTKYALLPHKGTYLLPFVYNTMPHEEIYSNSAALLPTHSDARLYKNQEAEFQISFLFPVENNILGTDFDLNVAYTHHAWWQIYNSEWSRPFRETNYTPEIFVRKVNYNVRKIFGFNFLGVDVGYVHQSNGQIHILSRSWDRIFARVFLRNHDFVFLMTGWIRIPEAEDQNPDIVKYMGVGELEVYRSFGKHTLTAKVPLFSKNFSLDLKYSYPWKDRLRWFVSIQSGYGHSLIEHDVRTERYGAGIILDSFFNGSPQAH